MAGLSPVFELVAGILENTKTQLLGNENVIKALGVIAIWVGVFAMLDAVIKKIPDPKDKSKSMFNSKVSGAISFGITTITIGSLILAIGADNITYVIGGGIWTFILLILFGGLTYFAVSSTFKGIRTNFPEKGKSTAFIAATTVLLFLLEIFGSIIGYFREQFSQRYEASEGFFIDHLLKPVMDHVNEDSTLWALALLGLIITIIMFIVNGKKADKVKKNTINKLNPSTDGKKKLSKHLEAIRKNLDSANKIVNQLKKVI